MKNKPKFKDLEAHVPSLIYHTVCVAEIGVIAFTANQILYINNYAQNIIGCNHIDNTSILDILFTSSYHHIIEAMWQGYNVIKIEDVLTSSIDTPVYIRGTLTVNQINEETIYTLIFYDITKETEVEFSSELEHKLLEILQDKIDVGILIFEIVNVEQLKIKAIYQNTNACIMNYDKEKKNIMSLLHMFNLTEEEIAKIQSYFAIVLSDLVSSECLTLHKVLGKDNKLYKLDMQTIVATDNVYVLCSFIDKTDEYKTIEHLESKTYIDELTSVYNRRYIMSALKDAIEQSEKYNTPLSLIVMDIDFFKKINDTHGHIVGDMVLQKVANIVSNNIRKSDIFGRYGGEEFIIICKNTLSKDATTLANKLRMKIEETHFGDNLKVTCSFGVTGYVKGESVESFIDRADKGLYLAKEAGRNKVIEVSVSN